MRELLAIVVSFIFFVNVVYGQAQGWTELFDGKTLKGWTVHSGSAKYHVEDGTIVGTTVPNSPNTFLCSDEEFSDFILEFEVYLVHTALNSGVQFRSIIAPEELHFWFRNAEGQPVEKKIPQDRVYGYQVEIASEAGGASGGVYDEARRAFMIYHNSSGSAASRAFKDDQWNKYQVICEGTSIKTMINGVACADFNDALTSTGIIGLQVHGVGAETTPYQVKWKNIRIKHLD